MVSIPVLMSRNGNTRWAIVCCAILAGLVLAAFGPVAGNGFINYDDPDYVVRNERVLSGLTWDNTVWAFQTFHAGNWHPITWLSHMVDCQFFGLNARAHHLTSLLFHLANSLILFFLMLRLTATLWRSAFVAALFALHPLHVESVAWISERKDVLSAFFGLLSIWFYASYARRTSDAPRSTLHALLPFLLSLVLFALGLMSKAMLVTLPFLLLLLDFWPLQRTRLPIVHEELSLANEVSSKSSCPVAFSRLVLEKLPFLTLAAISGVITFCAQKRQGAVVPVTLLSLGSRFEHALVSYGIYLMKTFWPVRLAVYYPLPDQEPLGAVALAGAGLTLISLSAVLLWRTRPYLAVGWLWFVGMLAPVSGLVQTGLQAQADRYSYLPSIGLFIVVAWGLADIARASRIRQISFASGSAAILVLCGILTNAQTRLWKDSETLFRHTIDITPENPVARVNLGSALIEEGKFAEAKQQFAEAVRLKPGYAEAQSNLGFALAMQGKSGDAVAQYRLALGINARLVRTRSLLGSALLAQGKRAEAVAEYRTALREDPDWPAALNDLAWVLATSPEKSPDNGAEAVRLAEKACTLTKFHEPLFIGTLAAAYARANRFKEAIMTAERAKTLAAKLGEKAIVERNEHLLELYHAGKPYTE